MRNLVVVGLEGAWRPVRRRSIEGLAWGAVASAQLSRSWEPSTLEIVDAMRTALALGTAEVTCSIAVVACSSAVAEFEFMPRQASKEMRRGTVGETEVAARFQRLGWAGYSTTVRT